ncbi:MAG: hypothetical protein ACK47B_28350 [Armatimonadota bacterium]
MEERSVDSVYVTSMAAIQQVPGIQRRPGVGRLQADYGRRYDSGVMGEIHLP